MAMSLVMMALFFAGNSVFAYHQHISIGYTNQTDREDEVPDCSVGGCGSKSCSIGASVNIWIIGASVQNAISCDTGYYACCNLGNTHCFQSSNCPVVDDIEEIDD